MNQDYQPSGFNMLPNIVKNLLIINGLCLLARFVIGANFGIDINKILGLYIFGSPNFKPWQIITHMFMHGNFTHLFFNMFALWMFGSVLENFWGSKKFLIFYFFTGIGAAVLYTLVAKYQISNIENFLYAEDMLLKRHVVGASGAVYGLLMAFGLTFPNTRVYLFFLFPLKAKYFVIIFGVLALYFGIANNPADNIAHFAHLGGMLFGFILMKYWNSKAF